MEHVFIIAEAGSNHDGDINRAKALITIAAQAGCNAVKFQLVKGSGEPHGQEHDSMFQPDWIPHLIWWCEHEGVEFMATPFNQAGIEALRGKVKHWKIASTEAADLDFVDAVVEAANGDPIFLSDGAVDFPVEAENIIPMACVVEYPAEVSDYHFLSGRWGLSDHTMSASVLPMMAVAAGASVIEKHFTDDKTRPGPDHSYALDPAQLKDMVFGVRMAEQIKNNKKKTITTYVGRKLQWP